MGGKTKPIITSKAKLVDCVAYSCCTSKEKLDSFVEYCTQNPTLRFWQALRAWAGVNFIFTSENNKGLGEYQPKIFINGLHDTFYDE